MKTILLTKEGNNKYNVIKRELSKWLCLNNDCIIKWPLTAHWWLFYFFAIAKSYVGW